MTLSKEEFVEALTLRREVDADGTVRWFNTDGQWHREDGPAYEGANGTKLWYKNNELHRNDGPAIEYADGTKKWYLKGKEVEPF